MNDWRAYKLVWHKPMETLGLMPTPDELVKIGVRRPDDTHGDLWNGFLLNSGWQWDIVQAAVRVDDEKGILNVWGLHYLM